MAYKFQMGPAILSGSLTQEGTVEIKNDAGAVVGVFDNDGVLSGALGATAASFTADGALTGGSLVVGSADMSETDLEKLDGITNGAGAANKALVLDANASIASGLAAITASSGIKAGELEAVGHVIAPALISTTTIQGAAISGSGDLNANRLSIGGPNFGASLASITDTGAATFASAKVSDLTQNRVLLAGANGELADNAKLTFNGTQMVLGAGTTLVAVDVSGSGVLSIDGIKSSGSVSAPSFVGTTFSGSGVGSFNSLDIDGAVVAGTSITAGTSFVIGSADLNETDLEKLDGITNGTAAANKALVADANVDIDGLRNITATGLLAIPDVSASIEVISNKIGVGGPTYAAALTKFDNLGGVSGSGNLEFGGTVQFDGVADTTFVAADSLYFLDSDGLMKRDSFTGIMSVAAGAAATTALKQTSGVLSLDIDNLGAEAIGTGDTIVFNDDDDNGLHKITLDNLFTKAPALLAAADIDQTADFITFLDGGATGDAKKESIADFVTAIAGSGMGTDGAGKLTVQGNTVTEVTVAVTALSEGYNYYTGSVNRSLNLPAAPSVGDVVYFKAQDLAAGQAVTISRQGSHLIDNEQNVVLESDYGTVGFVYLRENNWGII